MSDKKMQHHEIGARAGGLPDHDDPNRIISQKLKALYDSVEQEGIPDRFLDLLEKLDQAEASQKKPETPND